MFSVHQQTIRLYEKEGLISPKRSSGNTRLFSEDDVDRLEEIIYLTHKLGVNLAGVEVILGLQKKVNKLQKEINKLFEQTQEQLEDEGEVFKESAKRQAKRLVEIKKTTKIKTKKKADPAQQDIFSAGPDASADEEELQSQQKPVDVEIVDDDGWELEYDDD